MTGCVFARATLALTTMAAIMLLASPGTMSAQGVGPTPTPALTPTKPGVLHGLIDVGGYRLYIICFGEGSPTVVLDAGLGDDWGTWDTIQPEVGTITRTCSYSRAGLGTSDPDPGPRPRTSQRIVDELHTLLHRAGINPPYVLVGHSWGGLNVRLYASQYPDEVVGLVLVDASPEDPARLQAILPVEQQQQMLLDEEWSRNPEQLDIEASRAQVRAARPPPPIPVVVLTRGRAPSFLDYPPGFPAELIDPLEQAWRDLQADLARRVPDSRHIIADESGHYIHRDQPELVVDAIRQTVEAAAAAQSPSVRVPRMLAGLAPLLVALSVGALLLLAGLRLSRRSRTRSR